MSSKSKKNKIINGLYKLLVKFKLFIFMNLEKYDAFSYII